MDISFPGPDEQERALAEAKNAVKRAAFHLRKAVEEDNMREALRFSAAMLGELRTSQLSPQKYYELYMLIFDQLVNLEAFFADERAKGRTFTELYELVQHAGNVLPRLYLMVAVGCLYIKSKEGKAKEILKDLVELCKGVQHPTRGLFLRSYLCQRSKGVLPDTGSAYEGEGGNIHDALDFLLSNFIEMNKLWVRMQHQGSARDKDKREKERQQLQDLVGKNLTYLSQLDGLDYDMYSSMVLPRVMEQIVSCKDDIAQQYLMQCVIQGFPDAFHLGTLDSLLGALPELQPGVKVHTVMASLMDRLARYAQSDAGAMQCLLDMKAFEQFRGAIAKVLEAQANMAPADAVEMYVALLNFTGSVLPNVVENVNEVLSAAYKALSEKGVAGDPRAEKQLVALLTIPLTKYDVVTGLGMTEYPLLMGLLRHRTHKELAVKIIQTIVDSGTLISSVDKVEMLFRFIQPLVYDAEDGPHEEQDDEDVEEEQILVARLLHNLVAADIDTHHAILVVARKRLLRGGPRRMRHTLPALVFCILKLVRCLATGSRPVRSSGGSSSGSAGAVGNSGGGSKGDGGATDAAAEAADGTKQAEPGADDKDSKPSITCEALLQWLLDTCLVLAEVPEPMMALRLLLYGVHSASEEAGLEMLAYEFFEQAFTLYEESIADQRQRITALQSIIGTLQRCYVFGPENRDALVQNATGYSSRLLKRSDQCKAVCACSYLSWQDERPSTPERESTSQPAVRDGNKVLACLKRAIKVANSAKQQVAATARQKDASYVALYVEILNHYLHYFDAGVELFTPSVIQQIIELIQGELQSSGSNVDVDTLRYWRNTVRHIEQQRAKDGDTKQRYASLTVAPVPAIPDTTQH